MGETTRRWNIPLDHLDFRYLEKCEDAKEVERIVRILRAGSEGSFPQLLQLAESRLKTLKPESKVLRRDEDLRTMSQLNQEERDELQSDLASWLTHLPSTSPLSASPHAGKDIFSSAHDVRRPAHMTGSLTAKGKAGGDAKTRRVAPRSAREWDKFDVEAECSKVDESGGGGDSGGNVLRQQAAPERLATVIDKTGLSDDEITRLSEVEKLKGNESFRSKDYAEAMVYYNRALSLVSSPQVLNNRSLVYLHLEKWDRAISDTTEVLSLEPSNVKALLRRATAYKGKRRWTPARQDVEQVLLLEPDHSKATELLTEIVQQVDESRSHGNKLVIEEEGSSDDEESADAPGQAPSAALPPPAAPSQRPPRPISPLPQATITEIVDEDSEEETSPVTSPAALLTQGRKLEIEEVESSSEEVDEDVEEEKVAKEEGEKEQVLTPFTFARDWPLLTSPQSAWLYLSRIYPARLPALLSTKLEAALLKQIFAALEWGRTAQLLSTSLLQDYLSSLTDCSRFSTISMFLSWRRGLAPHSSPSASWRRGLASHSSPPISWRRGLAPHSSPPISCSVWIRSVI